MNMFFVGFGDLARRVWQYLPEPTQTQSLAVTRSPKIKASALMPMLVAEADSSELLKRFTEATVETVFVSLTPKARDAAGYEAGYETPLKVLVQAWQKKPPGHVIWVSSTGVYGQNQGEWVDETSKCAPTHYAGQSLLRAEALLAQSGVPHTVLRLAGIYGPGRDFLIRQVRAGNGGDAAYTNRIHVEDAAAFAANLIQSDKKGVWGHRFYNVCDSAPVPSNEVRQWLADQMGVTQLTPREGGRGANKRVSNQRLLATGFQLRYPSFKEGYATQVNPGGSP